ncbi:hypothetical protein [Nonomuraea typhae]|uniref:Uncharacterized protein n=1 Tax=Nonomuraea typhae TaxID=2603600 RepID=A0ABW7ZBQ3_9ACTN
MDEIGGRLLLRVEDGCDGLGAERTDTHVIDGYPEINADDLGRTIIGLAATAEEVPRPSVWPDLSEYSKPLLSLSFIRSFRQWQRSARCVRVVPLPAEWHVERWIPELGKGSWSPPPDSAVIVLPAEPEPLDLGEAVLTALHEPPLSARSP